MQKISIFNWSLRQALCCQLKSCQNVSHQMGLKSCMVDYSFSRTNLFRLRIRTSCTAATAGIYFSQCSLKDFFVCTFKLFSALQKPLKILHLGKQRKGISVEKIVFFYLSFTNPSK